MFSIFDEIDRIFEDARTNRYYVPPGYKLVEDQDYKKKRLEKSVDNAKERIQYYENQIKELNEKISVAQKELLALSP